MMRKYLSVLVFAVCSAGTTYAQDDLFGSEKVPVRHGFIFGANGDFDLPGGDMAKRFGESFRIGPSLMYQTESNWLFGMKGDFIFGNKIKEPDYMANVRGADGMFITGNSDRENVGYFERGYTLGVHAGRIIPLKKHQTNTGLLVQVWGRIYTT